MDITELENKRNELKKELSKIELAMEECYESAQEEIKNKFIEILTQHGFTRGNDTKDEEYEKYTKEFNYIFSLDESTLYIYDLQGNLLDELFFDESMYVSDAWSEFHNVLSTSPVVLKKRIIIEWSEYGGYDNYIREYEPFINDLKSHPYVKNITVEDIHEN